jgi:septal ring-binding cell division protein DamX
MSAEKGSSKADTLVKVVLVFFISLLSFSVGTFVGKQVSDSDHRRMALEGEFKGDRSVASTDEHAEDDEKITQGEVDSLTEEFVNKEKSAREPAEAASHDAHAEPAHGAKDAHAEDGYKAYKRGGAKADAHHAEPAPAPAKPAAKPAKEAHAEPAHGEKPAKPAPKSAANATDGAHKAAEKVAHGEAPTDGAVETRKPSSALPSVASSAIGKYTVQVASYADEKEAKGHAAGLKGKGYNAFYLPANVNGRTWYRVLVGLFNNSKSAGDFRAQFMKEANTKSAIVQRIVQ